MKGQRNGKTKVIGKNAVKMAQVYFSDFIKMVIVH